MRRIWNKMAALVVAAAVAVAAWPAGGVMAADGDITAIYTGVDSTEYKPPKVFDTTGDTSKVADYDVYFVPSLANEHGLSLTASAYPTYEFEDYGNGNNNNIIKPDGTIDPHNLAGKPNRPDPTVQLIDQMQTIQKTIRLFEVAAVDVRVTGNGTVTLDIVDQHRTDTNYPNGEDTEKRTCVNPDYFVLNYKGSNNHDVGDRAYITATFTPGNGKVLGRAEWKKDGVVQLDTVDGNEMDIGLVEGHYYHLEVGFVDASIYGVVTGNGGFVEGAMVYALDINNIIVKETKTDVNGYYAFGGLPDGKYTVVVCKPGFRKETLPVTAPVGLAEDVPLLSQAPVGHAIITVTDTLGNAVSGSTLYVKIGDQIDGPITIKDYRYILGDLAAGTYNLIVSKEGYVTQMTELEVTANHVNISDPMLKKTIELASVNGGGDGRVGAGNGEGRGFSFGYSAPETAPLPGTNPGLVNIINQAKSNGDPALILHMGTGVGEGYRDLTPDVLAAIIASGLDVIFQYGSGFAVLIPNAVFQNLGSDELIRVALSNTELPQSALDKGGNIDPANADLMKRTAFEVNMFQGGTLVGSFEGRRVNFAVNMGGFNLTEKQKSMLVGFRTDGDGNLEPLSGNIGPRDFNFNSNRFSKYGVMIADAPVKSVDLRMTLDVKGYTVNGARKTLATPPEIIDGRVMVPLRFVAEDLGAEVQWDEALKKASVKLGDKLVSVTAGVRAAGMDTKPVVVNDCLLVPIRFVAESLGCTVDWNEKTKTLAIMK